MKNIFKCNFQFLGGSPCIEYCKYEKEENTNVINFAGYSKCVGVTEEETDRRKGKGRRCCLWDVLEWCNNHLRAARTIWSKVFKKKTIHFGRVVVWCGVNQIIIHFSEASILPRVCSSIRPFLQIILQLNLKCGMKLNKFWPPYSVLFCLFLPLWWAFYFTLIDWAWEWIVCPICQLQRFFHLWPNLLKQLV